MNYNNVVVAREEVTPDAAGEIFSLGSIRFPEEVKVFLNDDLNHRPVGYARLSRLDTNIVANIKLFNKIDNQENLMPSVSGRVHKRNKNKLEEVHVTYISLAFCPNADSEIKTLGYYK